MIYTLDLYKSLIDDEKWKEKKYKSLIKYSEFCE